MGDPSLAKATGHSALGRREQLPEMRLTRFLDPVCAVLLFSFALAVAYPRWNAGIDWRDEGLLAYGTVRVANGEIPHRDFVSLQPPLSFYTAAAFFKLFGTSLATLRKFGLAISLLLPLLIYGIGRSLKASPVLSFAAAAPACILGLPYCYFVPLAVWQGIAASLAAVLLFVPAVLTKRQWLALPAGLLTAASLLLRHDQAIYTMISLVGFVVMLFLVRSAAIPMTNLKRAVLFWLGGVAIVSVPLIIIFWSRGALPEMFRQLVVFPFATYRKTSPLPFPKITAGKSAVETAVVLLFYLPPVVQAIAAVYLVQAVSRRRFGLPEVILGFLAIWSILFFLQVGVRSDQTHLLITLPPFFLLTAFTCSILQEKIDTRYRANLIAGGIFALLAGVFLWFIRSIVLPDVSRAKESLALERGGIRVEQQAVIVNFVESLQAYVPPNRSILALPYQPMFYFLCERRNPTRWNYFWPGDQTSHDHQLFIEEAERDPPAVILLSERPELAVYAPVIVEYIDSHYEQTDQFGQLAIYVRRDAE